MYSPRIKDSQIEKIFFLSRKLKMPMTRIVKIALEEFFLKNGELLLEFEKQKLGSTLLGDTDKSLSSCPPNKRAE